MRIQLSGKRFSFPPFCVCCGNAAETEIAVSASRTTGKRVVTTKTNTWAFPYCRACVAHVAAWDAAGGCGAIALVLVIALMVAIAAPPIGLAIAIFGIWAVRSASNRKKQEAKQMCSPQCTSAHRAVDYIGWSGTVETFDIASERYAVQFMLTNRAKLVNVSPETWGKLAQAHTAPTTITPVTTNETALPLLPSTKPAGGDVLLRWVSKVEGTKGPASRRATIELALKDSELTDGHREEFIKAAAQIEVRATLDKVDGLKTHAAKRRHLEDALRALRGDSAPDELQAEEIRGLEDVLRDLGGT
jgi:hypothetical protein